LDARGTMIAGLMYGPAAYARFGMLADKSAKLVVNDGYIRSGGPVYFGGALRFHSDRQLA